MTRLRAPLAVLILAMSLAACVVTTPDPEVERENRYMITIDGDG